MSPVRARLAPWVRPRVLAKGLVLILSFAAVGYLLKATGLGQALDKHWIDVNVRDQGLSGEAIYLAVGILAMAVGVPRQLVCFLGGYAFGLWLGGALAILTSGLSCVLAFSYARFFGRAFVQGRFAGRVKTIDDFLKGNPFTMTLLIRLLPVGNNLVTNLAGGVSSVPLLPFVAGSALGYIPQTLIFVLLGSGVHLDPVFNTLVSAALFVVSGVLGVYLYRRYRHGRKLDDQLDAELENNTQ
ncbi:MAG: TVP38/TMEM64 family protein [Rhodospirillales bacterium]|nr:TVP38/TMEM64 family protein [Rhodospirillales bacterium]